MVGTYLKSYMREKGIKQSYVAEKVNLTPQVLGAVLKGKRKLEVSEFYSICAAIGADPTQIAIDAGIYNIQNVTA